MNGPTTAPRLYRVYHLSPAGRILRAEILEADDDGEGLAKLRDRHDDHAVELWDRSRFVGKVEATLRAATAAADTRGTPAATASTNRRADLFKPLFADAETDEVG